MVLYIYIYLFAFCVIQSCLCEMALLLFKINQMLRSKCFVYLLSFTLPIHELMKWMENELDQLKIGSGTAKL